MEKIRATIEQHARWSGLSIYIDRMESALDYDFSLALENAKSLLESIGKEICTAKGEILPASPTINDVLKKSFSSLGYSNRDLVNQVSRSLANIGQEIGNIRNEISPTSHGKSLKELEERNNKIDWLTREFLIDSTLVVAVFLIRAFEHENIPMVKERLNYSEATDFNEFWDDSFGEFEMGDYSYIASEILYNVDYKAYESEYKAFAEADQVLESGEE